MANLKYPKMDATNDTEVVKQSTSSMVSVFGGMFLAMISIGILVGLAQTGLSNGVAQIVFLIIFTILAGLLWLRLTKISDKRFDEIQV
jgi:ABC-2 type transport system permease protein